MKSKLPVFLLVIGLMSMFFSNRAQAQNSTHDTVVINMLRDFYTSYIYEFLDESSAREYKLHAILKKYCTASLIKKLPKLADQTDSDPILQAQDSDSALAKSMVIKKDFKRPNVYIVSYVDDSNSKSVIHLLVVKQKESCKVADIW